MNNSQAPRVKATPQPMRLIIAGLISTLIYCLLTGAIRPSSLVPAPVYTWHWTQQIAWWSIVMLQMPGLILGSLIASIVRPYWGSGSENLFRLAGSVVFWFTIGAIAAFVFRKNRSAVVMWVAMVGVIELFGWMIAFSAFAD